MPAFPPGPGPLTAIRGMLPGRDMARIPAFFRATVDRYGPIASFRIARRRFFFVNDPAAIEELLVTRGRSFVKGRGTERLGRLLGQGLLTSNGALHLRQRRLVQPAFHRERIAAYAAAMVARAERFARGVAPGQKLEIDAEMSRLTLGIAAETLFGTDVDRDAGTIGAALDEAMNNFALALSPAGELLDHLPMIPAVRRFNAARGSLDSIVYRLIYARKRERRIEGVSEAAPDVLGMLLEAADAEGGMSVEHIRDEVMTIFLAGHETTANALTWTWWLLAGHPAVEARLHDELRAVLGERAPAVDDVPALRYTRDVIAEAMRLYPPAWVVGRRAIEPVELGGWTVPKDGVVLASQWVTHREPRLWHQPEAFRPERWSNGETDGLPKFAYFPFGGGNRLCIGESFAWTETTLVLATIARRLRFRAAPGFTAVAAKPLVTLRPASAIPMVAEVATRPCFVPEPLV
jgi:cytochrome P450